MKDRRRWGSVVLLCAFVCIVLWSLNRSKKGVPQVNRMLSVIKLPVLPEGVTEARCASSGIFAKFANVKFTASRSQALEFLTSCAVPHYSEFHVTDGSYQICATHVLTTPSDVNDVRVPAVLRLGTGIVGPTWFKSVLGIRHGWFYRFEKHPVRYQFYYDLDAGQFYIYWSYS